MKTLTITHHTGSSGDVHEKLHDVIEALRKTIVPVGTVADYCGTAAPTYWLLCYGQAISRTTYSALFAVLSTTYGVGDGSTTFNLPDCRGRVVAGQDDMGGSSADRLTNVTGGIDGDVLGGTGGAESHALTTAQLATHNHGVTDAGHSHSFPFTAVQDGGANNVPATGANSRAVSTSLPTSATNSNTTGITINNAGSGTAHNNVQPTIILNKIIFAGV